MITKKLQTEGSAILSQRDLQSYFNNENYRRNASTIFTKSQCPQSPQISTESKEDKSDGQTGSQNLEEEIQRLNTMISLEKDRFDNLNSDFISLANELNLQQTLAKEYKSQKDKLVEQIHYIRKGYEQIQEQRNKLLAETGRLRNQVNIMRATIDVNEDQISTLDNANRKLIDEINFEKQINADFKQENAMFKAQLKNISTAFINLKQYFQVQREKQLAQSKETINKKINEIRSSLSNFKVQMKELENQQKEQKINTNEVYTFVRRMQLHNEAVRTQLNIAKSLSNSFDDTDGGASLFLARESQFRKTIESQQQKIKTLSAQITSLKKINFELAEEIRSNTHVQLLAPRFHTNTTFVNKMLKQRRIDLEGAKEDIEMKQDQIDRLNQALELQKSNSVTKTQEIERLQVLLKIAQNKQYTELNDQISDLNTQKLRLTRRIEQLNQNQHALKAQIAEKDRIIMNYVQKAKANV